MIRNVATFHTEAERAVQAAIKTEVSYQNDTILIAFFFAAYQNKDNAKSSCFGLSSNTCLESSWFNLTRKATL